MPIRFSCTTCGQRLSVGERKAGERATCPKCKTALLIPAQSVPLPENPTNGSLPPAMSMVSLADDRPALLGERTEVVYEQTANEPSVVARNRTKSNAHADLDLIALPRYVIFAQGFLLAFVGILCFLLGLAVGGAITQGPNSGKNGTEGMRVVGMVSLLEKGKRLGDMGAIIVLLPLDAIPENKGPLIGLRPGDASAETLQSQTFLKEIGGAMAKCDERGRFETKIPKRGKYYLLAISSTGALRASAPPSQQQVGQMAKFFDMAGEPLEKFRFQWRIVDLRNETPLNVDFD